MRNPPLYRCFDHTGIAPCANCKDFDTPLVEPDFRDTAVKAGTDTLTTGMWVEGTPSDVAMLSYVVLKSAAPALYKQWEAKLIEKIEEVIWTDPEKATTEWRSGKNAGLHDAISIIKGEI